MHVDAFAQDDAGAEEADAAHHLGGDARRIALADQAGEHDEARRAQRDQGVGPQPRHLLVPLALEADRTAEQQRRRQAQAGVSQALPSSKCMTLRYPSPR